MYQFSGHILWKSPINRFLEWPKSTQWEFHVAWSLKIDASKSDCPDCPKTNKRFSWFNFPRFGDLRTSRLMMLTMLNQLFWHCNPHDSLWNHLKWCQTVKSQKSLGQRSGFAASSLRLPVKSLTLWFFNIAMENDAFIDAFPSYKPPFVVDFHGFSMAMKGITRWQIHGLSVIFTTPPFLLWWSTPTGCSERPRISEPFEGHGYWWGWWCWWYLALCCYNHDQTDQTNDGVYALTFHRKLWKLSIFNGKKHVISTGPSSIANC